MPLSFDGAVKALADTTIRQQALAAMPDRDLPGTVGDFLVDVQARMPDYLRLPFRLLTLAFDAWSLPTAGKPFHRLPQDQRLRQVEAWKHSRIEARRRLIEFYESLTLFGLYSTLYGQDYAHAGE